MPLPTCSTLWSTGSLALAVLVSQLDRFGTIEVVNGSEVLLGPPFVLDADNIKPAASNSTPPVLTDPLPVPNLL